MALVGGSIPASAARIYFIETGLELEAVIWNPEGVSFLSQGFIRHGLIPLIPFPRTAKNSGLSGIIGI
jgi:hypothetical protein